MIENYLQDYVTRHIWCAPFQDNQIILKLSRLSFPTGTMKHVDIGWDDITLPDNDSAWTLYNIGQNTAWRTNLSQQKMKWLPLTYWGELNKTLFDLYFNTGKKVPTYQAYVLLTEDNGYVLAVRMDQKYYDLVETPLYLRAYKNSFWMSSRSNGYPYTIEYGGGKVLDRSVVAEYLADIALLRHYPGIVNVFHNGVWVENLSKDDVLLGDHVEYIHDGAVKRVVDFNVSHLRDFLSELDGVKKYLLHPPKETENLLRYRDDIDVFLYKKTDTGAVGRYYHRHVESSLRMVTHADYSIPVANVLGYTQDPDDPWVTREELVLRLHIRESGYARTLVNESTHLTALYRLPDAGISRALLGIDATLAEWYAPTLEQSYYTKAMRKWWPPFDYDKMLTMLGYDAMSTLLSPSPIDVEGASGTPFIPLTAGQQNDVTVFEYNQDGEYLGWHYHSSGERYRVRDTTCAFGEVYLGEGTPNIEWVVGNDDVTLLSGRTYRFYYAKKTANGTFEDYRAAEPGVHYTLDLGVVKWIHRKTGFVGVVWSDKRFLINDVTWHSPEGVYRLQINHSDVLGVPLPIPTETLMVIINGQSAVEGIDYYVNWPVITVVSCALIDPTKENRFTLVGMGMRKDMSRSLPDETGFVFKGIVSANRHFDLREGRVMRHVVGGRVKRGNEIYFAEDMVDDTKPLSKNGDIYASAAVYTPLRDLPYATVDKLREQQSDINRRLENFLTVRYPQPEILGPSPITARHKVYSPLLTQLLYDIRIGKLTPPDVPENHADLERAVSPYLNDLPTEPSSVGIDTRYVILVPHPFDTMIEVTSLIYRFFENVSRTYLKGQVSLTTHFTIKG